MAGSGQETDLISGKKMTSRLKLRKKKYPPPFEDPKNKDTEDMIIKQDHKTTESCIKTNTSSTNTSKISTSKINTSKTYADIVGGSRKTGKENKIFMNSKANAQKHNLIKNKNTEDVNINKDQLIIDNCRKTNTSKCNTSKTNTSKTNTSTTNNRKTFAEIVGG